MRGREVSKITSAIEAREEECRCHAALRSVCDIKVSRDWSEDCAHAILWCHTAVCERSAAKSRTERLLGLFIQWCHVQRAGQSQQQHHFISHPSVFCVLSVTHRRKLKCPQGTWCPLISQPVVRLRWRCIISTRGMALPSKCSDCSRCTRLERRWVSRAYKCVTLLYCKPVSAAQKCVVYCTVYCSVKFSADRKWQEEAGSTIWTSLWWTGPVRFVCSSPFESS